MASKNETVAHVRVTIGGVEVTQKHLNALRQTAQNTGDVIVSLKKSLANFMKEGDLKGAAEVTKKINEQQNVLKNTRQLIAVWEREVNNYVDVMEHISEATVADLNRAARNLQAQMKQTVTAEDTKEWKKLNDAYREVMLTMEQLSGKAPNLRYVMENLGKVSNQSLAQSAAYLRQLMQDTDKTTKKGRDALKQWGDELHKVQAEQAARAQKVLANKSYYSEEQIRSSIQTLQTLQKDLRTNSAEWKSYADSIQNAKEYLDEYARTQKETQEALQKKETDRHMKAVIASPSTASVAELKEAIKYVEQLRDAQVLGSNEWQKYSQQIERARQFISHFESDQRQFAMEDQLKNIATLSTLALSAQKKYWQEMVDGAAKGSMELQGYETMLAKVTAEEQRRANASYSSKAAEHMDAVSAGSFTGSSADATQAINDLKAYRDSLSIGSQAAEINQATEAIKIYENALKSVKETVVDVQKVMADPTAYGQKEIEEAIRILEEEGKKISIGDAQAISDNAEAVAVLRNELEAFKYASENLDRVVENARQGTATVAQMERAVKVLNDRLAVTPTNQSDEIEAIRRNLDELNPRLAMARTSIANVRNVLSNLDTASLASLREAAKALKDEMENVRAESREFVAASRNLEKVKERIKDLEGGATALDKAFSRLKNWVLVYAGASEIWNQVKTTFNANLTLADQMSDVQKTTGLAADEVMRLSDEMQKLDTRISNEKLMATAAEAGRIGLSSREDVLGFVKASAVTLTALEELDEKAISSVMKLNDLLGETKRLGVEQAILSTASSINELSQASAAAPEPIINFSRRFGGIALQANISTAEVLAMGATLDALNQPIEMSSTALNKFTTALITNGKAIAQDTGLSEDYYNSMLREGKTVELMIQVLSRLNNMGGLQNIAQYMKDMGSDGARMTQIISAMAGTLPQLRANLELAKQSFEEGTSVTSEYNVKNENAAALMERIGNIIRESFVNSSFVAALTQVLSSLHQFVVFITSGSAAAISFNAALTLLFTSFIGRYKGMNEKLLAQLRDIRINFRSASTGALSLGTALKSVAASFKTIILQNPLGWALTALTVIPQVISLFSRTREEMEGIGNITARISQRFDEADFYIGKMRKDLEEASGSTKNYSGIIAKLNLDYKDYLGHLISESAGYREVAASIDAAAAAQRRKIIEDERANVMREVNDKYRPAQQEATTELHADVVTDNSVFVSGGEKVANDLFRAMVSGLRQGSKEGELVFSKELEDILRMQSDVFASKEIENFGPMARRYGSDQKKLSDMYYNTFVSRIKSLDSAKKLAEVVADKEKETKALTIATDAELTNAFNVELKARADEIDAMMESLRFVEKAAKDYTAADEVVLSNLIQASQQRAKVIRESGMDPAKKTEKLKKEEELIAMLKKKEREVLLAFVENPLKGYDFRVDDNGKLLKKVDENGQVLYKAVEKLSDADLDMLRRAYLRTEETLGKLLSDNDNLMDSSVREMAAKLSKVKENIKKELNNNGLLIDEKGVFSLRTTSDNNNSYEKEMQRAYRALLSGLDEYFAKEKQLANEQYINSEMTHEQHQKRMDEIQRQHLLVRASMQKELVSHTEMFDEEKYLGNDPKVLGNYGRVKEWMPSGEHNFQASVKADAEKGLNEIKEMTISTKEEIDKILLDNNAFVNTSRQYQEELEKLSLLFVNLEGIGADDFKGMQEKARQAMSVLSQAARDTTDMSYRTFRDTVASYSGVGDTLIATQQQDGTILLKGTEQQWEAIYAIIMRYNNDIDEQRTQLFEKNKRMVEKMIEQDERIRSLTTDMKGTEDAGKEESLYSSWGTKSKGGQYRSELKAEEDMLDAETQIYLRKYEIMQEYYDKRMQQEEDLEMRQELQREREMALNDLTEQYQEEQAERFRNLTELYMQEYDRRLEKATDYADRIGEFAGTMASAEWNSVEDRKRAGEEMIRFMAEETKRYLLELLTRSIKKRIQDRLEEKRAVSHQTAMSAIDQQGATTRTMIAQMGGQAKVTAEQTANTASEAQNLSHNITTATQDMTKAQVSTAQGVSSGSAKIIGELGWWGIPLIAVITGLLNMLLSSAMSSFSSAYGSAEKVNSGGKRLAAGMLTYAEGRYPVRGNDGKVYDAEYEPSLETGIYDGGSGKAHFGIFSEKMPEMVVSGPTTRIIQQDYPQLLQAIMTIDRHGRLRNAMPAFADGNVSRFSGSSDSYGSDNGGSLEQAELLSVLRTMNDTNMRLSRQLGNGIRASINMYGKGGAKESMDKADKFYRKNKIKN